jgi:type I restriction enzyme, S subunit
MYLIVRIMDKHKNWREKATLGSVKAEKISHVFESHLGIDLGRQPERLAAGPADFPRLQQVAHRAAKKYAFQFADRDDVEGHEFLPLNGFSKALRHAEMVFASQLKDMDELISLFVPMTTKHAEAVATLYASWNDFLASGKSPSDDEIIVDFYGWSADKRERFKCSELVASLKWMRDHGLVPTGKGKRTRIKK